MSAVMEAREPSAKYLSTPQPPLVRQFDLLATAPDGVAELRELILTLAMQGKLVPQDPRDEPARELLKKIRSEEDRLIAEGKIKRDKLLVAIAEEEKPFSLPRGWEWTRFSALAVFENGDRGSNYPSRSSFVDKGVAFINAGHLAGERIDYADMNYITPEKFSLLRSGKVQRNDILYCLRGSLGKFALMTDDAPGAIASSLVIVRLLDPAVTTYTLSYLKSPLAARLIKRFDNGTAQPNLGAGDLAKFVFPLPPAAEQARIVARVEELMRLCDALEAKGQLEAAQHAQLVQTLLGALIASTSPDELADNWQRVVAHFDLLLDRPEAIDDLEQTTLQLAVRGLLVPQDPKEEPASELLKKIRAEKDRLIAEGKIKRDKPLKPVAEQEMPFELPHGWEWVRLGVLTNLITSGSRDWAEHYSDSGPIFVRMGNLSRGGYELRMNNVQRVRPPRGGEGARTSLEPNDLLLSITGEVGMLGLVPEGFGEAYINQHTCLIRWASSLRSEFLPVQLLSAFVQQQFNSPQRGIKNSFRLTDVSGIVLALPPLSEQGRIVAQVKSLRGLCADLRQRLAARQVTLSHLAEALIDEVA